MARAKPDVTFQWERLVDVLEEALPLIQLHAGELGQEIEPNWEAYKQYALADILQILTVRDKGMLVGYNAVVVFPSLYCKSEVQAYMTFWLHPAWRYGWTGVRLLREAERQLKRRDVKRVIIDLRYCGTAAARLLEKLGYGPRSTNFAKELS